MDDPKRRILRLIEEDKYRITGHFNKRCKERDATLEDGLRILKNGVVDRAYGDVDPKLGAKYRFNGLDTKDKNRGVVVAIEEKPVGVDSRLWFITILPEKNR